MRVQIVDPAAYTPPYDHALAAALARAGAEIELVTARFPYGSIPQERGYRVSELFYRASSRPWIGPRRRRLLRAVEHLPGMRRYRRGGGGAALTPHQRAPASPPPPLPLPPH